MELRRIEFHPEAVDEAVAARRWYAEINSALGQAFVDELDRAVAEVASAPDRWARYVHGTRVFLFHRFPYLLIYRLHDDRVQVVAVQHVRRRPGYWKTRSSR